jgi:uncharacterized protein (TIGR03118 family)
MKINLIKLSILLMVLMLAAYPAAAKQDYKQTNLVSDVPGLAKFTDKNLVNPWGLVRSSTSPWWISDNGMGVSTLYNGSGNPFPPTSPLVVTVDPSGSSPTGAVFNSGPGFKVSPVDPAKFIFVSEDGRITGWNPSINPINATIKVDNSARNAVYKGAAIANYKGKDYLYVANFRNGTIEVYDTSFKKVSLGDKFKDTKIPKGFAPFNVANINGDLFVTFAKQDKAKHDDAAGPGLGYVDKFSPNGKLLMRLNHGPWMNSPWGIALAPNNFGKLSNKLLVGNFGSGNIGIFDPKNGNFNGFFKDDKGKITIDGLWALVFGNGVTAGPNNVLFFTAGIQGEAHGLFGMIAPTK